MNIEDYRNYCLSIGPGVEERMPFGAFKAAKDVLAFYVCGHMFSYFNTDHFSIITLKCQPDRINALKEENPAIGDPYNMSVRHWIGVDVATVSETLLRELTLNSYNLVKMKYNKGTNTPQKELKGINISPTDNNRP